jgi:very-short-patch-repair endonuclease
MLQQLEQIGIPAHIVDIDSLTDIIKISRKSQIVIRCSCGTKLKLKISSILRTIKRVGHYRCLSCGIKSKHTDKIYQERHKHGIIKSWSDDKRKKQSEISKERWSNPESVQKLRTTLSEVWKDTSKRRQASITTSNLWKDPIYRNKYVKYWSDPKNVELQREKIRKLHKNEEYVEKQRLFKSTSEYRYLQSDLAIERWKNLEYRNLIIKSQKLVWSNVELRKLVSDNVKKLWKDPIYIEKQLKAASDKNLCILKSENAKNQWKNQKIRSDITAKIKETYSDPKHKIRVSEFFKSRWSDPVFKEKMAKARSSILFNGKDSILERVAQQLLESLDIKFVRHHVIGYFEFDLYVPDHNLLVECNGEYWHSIRKSDDASKFSYIDKYFPDYRILYLWERDFLNPGLIKQKLTKELFDNSSQIEQCDFSFDQVRINKLNPKKLEPNSYYSAPEEFLQSFHYAGYGRTAKVVYGAFLDEKLIGVCKFASPVRKEVATSMNYAFSQMLELDRFCIHPQYQKKNFASWFISRCSKLIFSENSKLLVLVSFADSTFGHFGTIYKASNWKQLHVTKPDYHYISQEGFVIHKKTLYDHAQKMGKSESDYVNQFGYMKVFGKSKTKFVLTRD